MMKTLRPHDLSLSAVNLRNLWLRSNAAIFKNKFEHPSKLIHKSLKQLDEFRRAQIVTRNDSQQRQTLTTQSPPHWTRPPNSYAKVNWDTALDRNGKLTGFGGIIIRDSAGEVLVSAGILKIQLSPCPHPNKWVWFEEKHGKFTIKSAYRAIQKSTRRSQGDCSNSASLNPLWK